MAEKKRKRHDDAAERPTKKAAIASQGKVKVELLKNEELLGPLLGMSSLDMETDMI
jgi:DNA-directed RNA polymerase I subunit RPA49